MKETTDLSRQDGDHRARRRPTARAGSAAARMLKTLAAAGVGPERGRPMRRAPTSRRAAPAGCSRRPAAGGDRRLPDRRRRPVQGGDDQGRDRGDAAEPRDHQSQEGAVRGRSPGSPSTGRSCRSIRCSPRSARTRPRKLGAERHLLLRPGLGRPLHQRHLRSARAAGEKPDLAHAELQHRRLPASRWSTTSPPTAAR